VRRGGVYLIVCVSEVIERVCGGVCAYAYCAAAAQQGGAAARPESHLLRHCPFVTGLLTCSVVLWTDFDE
jgi:hypothetical protein